MTYISAGDGTLHTRRLDRLRVQNNLIYDLNGDGMNGWVSHVDGNSIPYQRSFGGYFLNGFSTGADYIVDHNTVAGNASPVSIGAGFELAEPGLINLKYDGAKGMVLTNNVLNLTSEVNGISGITAAGDQVNPADPQPTCNRATMTGGQLFSCMFPGSVAKNNVFLATAGSQSSINSSSKGWPNGSP